MKTYYVYKEFDKAPKIIEIEATDEALAQADNDFRAKCGSDGFIKNQIGNHQVTFDGIYMVCADDFYKLHDKPNFGITNGVNLDVVYGNAVFTRKGFVGEDRLMIGMEFEEAVRILEGFHEVPDGEVPIFDTRTIN